MLNTIFEALLKLVIKPSGVVAPQGTTCHIYSGRGSPETVVTAEPGSIYLNVAGGANTSLYVKELGSDNTGWVGK